MGPAGAVCIFSVYMGLGFPNDRENAGETGGEKNKLSGLGLP